MIQVIVFPRGQLSPKDKERLTKNGVIAIEADKPSDVVMLAPSSSLITPDDLLMAALSGANTYEVTAAQMTRTLYSRIKKREEKLEKE